MNRVQQTGLFALKAHAKAVAKALRPIVKALGLLFGDAREIGSPADKMAERPAVKAAMQPPDTSGLPSDSAIGLPYASRSIVMSGGATIDACKELIPRIVHIGAHLLGCKDEEVQFDKTLGVVGPGGKSVDLREICSVWYLRPDRAPLDVDRRGLEVSVSYKPDRDTGAFTYASHAVAVAVDVGTGHVEILDYVIAEDCGTMVNPLIVEGQTIGGVAQGIGTALFEEIQFDANGQPDASTLADYLLPGASEIPSMRIFHTETPSPYTRFGMKGMGEGGAIAPPAVIFNAVNDALGDMGVEVSKTPLTPHRLMEAILNAKKPAVAEAHK